MANRASAGPALLQLHEKELLSVRRLLRGPSRFSFRVVSFFALFEALGVLALVGLGVHLFSERFALAFSPPASLSSEGREPRCRLGTPPLCHVMCAHLALVTRGDGGP